MKRALKAKPKTRRTKPGCVSYLLRDVDADAWAAFKRIIEARDMTVREALLKFVGVVARDD